MDADAKRAYDRAYHAARSPEKKARKMELVCKRRKDLADVVRWYKSSVGCRHCGERTDVCLEFHHEGDDKIANVADGISHGWSLRKLAVEIRKCVVVCANCHRKLHAGLL